MPGPGGGGRGGGGHGGSFGGGGGGGFRGGGGGGGFRGGGFHGGFHSPYRRRGWFYGPGGGCLGGFFSMLLAPIMILLLLLFALPSFIGDTVTTITKGGTVEYNEKVMQDYADHQYAIEFGSSTAYEDNLLIVVTVNEEYTGYDFIAWVGDHVRVDINEMFGGNYSTFGRTMNSTINQTYFEYSLDSNLASVMDKMEGYIDTVTPEGMSSFTCQENHAQVESHLTNKAGMNLTDATVNDALRRFTDSTGIPVVIVVDTQENVFGRSIPTNYLFRALILVGLAVLCIWLLVRFVKTIRNRKENENERF